MELLRIKGKEILESNKKELFEIGKKAGEIDLEVAMIDASEHLIQAKKAQEILNGYILALMDATHDEVYSRGQGGELEVHNSKISLGSTGDRYDYEADFEYLKRKKALADRQELLKLAVKSDDKILDSEGEVVEPVPLKTASKEILKIKL